MSGRILAVVFLLLVTGCSSGGPDPRTLIPVDSDAWVAVSSPETLSFRVGPIVRQYPEYGGLVDLVRSVTGIDFSSPDKESGMDPERGAAVAWFRGGLLLIMPVADAKLAARRLSLRLARFGFVRSQERGPLYSFDSGERGHACFQINAGIAAVFVGPEETCSILPGIADKADDSDESVGRLDISSVSREMGVKDADIVFKIHNLLFGPKLLARAGISAKSTAGCMVAGMIGDLRGVVRIDRTTVLRAALGAGAWEFEKEAVSFSMNRPVREALEIDLTVGPSVRPLLDSVVALCGSPCRTYGIDMLFGSWDGRMRLVVPASAEKDSTRRSVVDSFFEVTSRITVSSLAGIRRSPSDVLNFVRRKLDRLGIDVGRDGPLQFKFDAYNLAVGGSNELMAVASGPAAMKAVTRALDTFPEQGLPTIPDDGRIASVRVNPEGALKLSGLGFLEYLRRLVNPVRLAGLDIYYQEGRVVVDGRMEIR